MKYMSYNSYVARSTNPRDVTVGAAAYLKKYIDAGMASEDEISEFKSLLSMGITIEEIEKWIEEHKPG